MSLKKSFELALANILYDKKRSVLTMLGIIVGVAAVIILISLMNGMTSMISDKFNEMGTTTLNITVQDRGGSRTVKEEDMYNLRDENPGLLSGVSPSATLARATVKTSDSTDTITTNATGVSEEYADMKKLNVTDGRFLDYMDIEKISKVCVVGTYIQKELFGMTSALGNQIKINGVSYTVVGVLEEKDDSESNGSDDVIYIPYTTALRNGTSSTVSSYTLTAASDDVVDQALELVKNRLLDILGDEDYFSATSMAEMIDMMMEMVGKMKILLVAIAGISLLVGGIGIMNIMLVSVTERTRDRYKKISRRKRKDDYVTVCNRGGNGQWSRRSNRNFCRLGCICNSREAFGYGYISVNRCDSFVVRRIGRHRNNIRLSACQKGGGS